MQKTMKFVLPVMLAMNGLIKRIVFLAAVVGLLLLSLCSCAKKSNNDRIITYPKLDLLPTEFERVFNESDRFIDTITGKEYGISDFNFLAAYGSEDELEDWQLGNLFWYEYTIMDLDGDAENELIYYVSQSDTYEGYYVILHSIAGKIYAYRVFGNEFILFSDGVIKGDYGSDHMVYYRIGYFTESGYTKKVIGQVTDDTNMDSYTLTYIVGNREVTEEYFYDTFIPEIERAGCVEWINSFEASYSP